MSNETLSVSMHPPGFTAMWTLVLGPGVTILTGINNVGKSRIFPLLMDVAGGWTNASNLASLGRTQVESETDNIRETLTIAPDHPTSFVQFFVWQHEQKVAETVASLANNSWSVRDLVRAPNNHGGLCSL